MVRARSSNLNPSADVFVPGKISNLNDGINSDEDGMQYILAPLWTIFKTKGVNSYSISLMKEIAKQLVNDYLTENKCHREETIAKQAITKIFERVFLTSSCKVDYNIVPIEARLLTLSDVEKLALEKENDVINYFEGKSLTFDPSFFKPPKPSIFLSSLYGLYRHEQAIRPLLSLTLPPSTLKDSVWSVTSKDLSLWNPSCDEPCKCPPMFGYCWPPSFFGNLFNLDYKCSKESGHFCRYPPSPNGNESILLKIKTDHIVEAEFLEDDCIEDKNEKESNLEYYLEQLKTVVTNVCDLISDETTKESKVPLIDDNKVTATYKAMFWDSDPSKFVRNDEILEDDNCHPLLEMDYTKTNEGVSAEIKEMIRKCSSPDQKAYKKSEVDEGIIMACCNPPCSVWCHDVLKFEGLDSVSSSSSVSANIGLLADTTDFLLNASKGNITSNGETGFQSSFHKRNFKRSFSVNDCDLSYEERYRINRDVPHFSTSSKEDLEFLRRDPINFFKSLRKEYTWKDNDSGIVSHCLSQEEMDNSCTRDGSFFELDHAPMWSLFNGKDSLWKPLPECSQQDQNTKFMPKRVRDLRRQRSLN